MGEYYTRKDLEALFAEWQEALLDNIRQSYIGEVTELETPPASGEETTVDIPEPLQKAAWSVILPFLGRLATAALGSVAGRVIGGALAGRTGATIGGRIGSIIGMLGGWDAVRRGLLGLIGRESPMAVLDTLVRSFPAIASFVTFLRALSPDLVSQFAEWLKGVLARVIQQAPPPPEAGGGGGAAPAATPSPTAVAMAKALAGGAPPYFSYKEEVALLLPLFVEFLKTVADGRGE